MSVSAGVAGPASVPGPQILVVGTCDTKSDELAWLRDAVLRAGGRAWVMDVGVLGHGHVQPDIGNAAVAAAAGTTLQALAASGDEHTAMAQMAQGAAALALQLHAAGQLDGLLVLGGTMGTDLALDVANALPLGVPKVVLSTVAHSHLIPPERVPPDLMVRLWAGGLYGLNRLCKTALSAGRGRRGGRLPGHAGRCRSTGRGAPGDRHDLAGLGRPSPT